MKERLATTTETLAALDDAELREGYNDGRANDPEPGPNRSQSYVHGWWQGMRDGGHREADPIDDVIVRAYLAGPHPAWTIVKP